MIRARRYRNERPVVLAVAGAATAVCLALELVREVHYADPGFRFLLWNLTLAWIPLVVALVVYDGYRRGAPLAVLAPGILVWLLFLPNAPYIATDFVHVGTHGPTPFAFDLVVVSAFACTGVFLGFVSLYLMQAVAQHRFGARTAWASAAAALVLASAGVYVGRFLQWNSWDLLVRPGERLAQIAPRLSDPLVVAHALALTFVVTALLATTYLVFHALVRQSLHRPAAARRRRSAGPSDGASGETRR
jgi:uncharacterized membrane protein